MDPTTAPGAAAPDDESEDLVAILGTAGERVGARRFQVTYEGNSSEDEGGNDENSECAEEKGDPALVIGDNASVSEDSSHMDDDINHYAPLGADEFGEFTTAAAVEEYEGFQEDPISYAIGERRLLAGSGDGSEEESADAAAASVTNTVDTPITADSSSSCSEQSNTEKTFRIGIPPLTKGKLWYLPPIYQRNHGKKTGRPYIVANSVGLILKIFYLCHCTFTTNQFFCTPQDKIDLIKKAMLKVEIKSPNLGAGMCPNLRDF